MQTNSQIDRVIEAVTDALAENNDTKRAFLQNPLFYCPYIELERCYWKVYKIFSLMCLDLYYVSEVYIFRIIVLQYELRYRTFFFCQNRYARLSKHIFVHACEADWLDLRKIANLTKTTCSRKEEILNGF